MSPTDAQIAEMRRLAEAATPGPWEGRYLPGTPTSCCEYATVSGPAGYETARIWKDGDVRYIAAAHPQAVLALLDALQAAREALRTTARLLREAIDEQSQDKQGPLLLEACDAARAALPQAAAEERGEQYRPPVCRAVKCAAQLSDDVGEPGEILWFCDLRGCPFSGNTGASGADPRGEG